MPATFSPDCMAVCVPPEQNETFIGNEDGLSLDDEGNEIIDDTECLISSTKNGHISIVSSLHDKDLVELESEPSIVTSRSVGVLPPIPESDGWESLDDDEDSDSSPYDAVSRAIRLHEDTPQEHHDCEDIDLPSFARVVPDEMLTGTQLEEENTQLFRDLLHLNHSEHVGFSGTDSHQYLFQHFDADALEYEEAAAVRPKFIGHYLLGDCLGEGSYAKVKEALDTDTLERAAVKIFSPVKLKRIPNGMQNVLKEVNILRKLDHPNVCRMKELLKKELKKKLYLIMDYAVCAISDLTKTLPQERLPAWKAHYYFVQLLDGLQYCHSKGVIHKDLKPSNLVITTQDTLKIIDFGVAEQLSPYASNDVISSSQGCPAVQAPEVADGIESFSGFKLDVWSCGVTFFSLCAGGSKFPFVGETVYELLANISGRPHEMPEDVRTAEPEFCLLIDAMLEKKEVNRPSLDSLRHHPFVRRHWPMPPAGVHVQEIIEKAERRSVESFLPYIQAYFHSSTRTSRAGSICCATGGRVPHHHHHYPRCHSHHLSGHASARKSCRQSIDRRRASIDSRHIFTHNSSVRSIHKGRGASHDRNQIIAPSPPALPSDNADQGCFRVKKWKICRIT